MVQIFICGVCFPRRKKIAMALTQIYGIGKTRAKAICHLLRLGENRKMKHLSKNQLQNINSLIQLYLMTGKTLQTFHMERIQRLQSMRCYRGIRHQMGLPLRGQRTSTNGKTQKSLASKRRRFG